MSTDATKPQYLKARIQNSISELEYAKGDLLSSLKSLKSSYSGEKLQDIISEYQNILTEIDQKLAWLENTVLVECNKNINQL